MTKHYICRLKRFNPGTSEYEQLSLLDVTAALQPNGELRIASDDSEPVIAQNLGESAVMLDAEEDV